MLFEIVENRRKKIAREKEIASMRSLVKSPYFGSECVSLKNALVQKSQSGIIAEFKRKSPSEGVLNPNAEVQETTKNYVNAGASALSILTEFDYFQGRSEDLTKARKANSCPILRKDFILDEYQIIQTKSLGADVVLLIAACLEKQELKNLYELAKSIGLEVLFEIHQEKELEKLPDNDLLIGVNNRNLNTMEVRLKTSIDLAEKLSKDFVLVSESGIRSAEDIQLLKAVGFSGFLMGTHFMKTPNPPETLQKLIANLQKETLCK